MKKMFALLFALFMLCTAAVAEETAPFTIYPPQKAHASFTLEGNPSTGYFWTAFLVNDGVVTLTDPEGTYTQDPAEEGMVGVGGSYTFEITAEAAGETILLFHYSRGWETETLETKAYLIQVTETEEMFIRDLEGMAPLTGQIVSVDAENRTALVETENQVQVLARFPQDMELPTVDENVNIWFNGVMTMSLPGQINVMGWESVPAENARQLQK